MINSKNKIKNIEIEIKNIEVESKNEILATISHE